MPSREIQTIMHPLKMRMLEVKKVQKLTPHMVRVTLTGEDLADFVSPSPDDHVKVFFPYQDEKVPVVPTMTPQGPVMAEGQRKPQMRDYTPRRFDNAAKELDLDFYLHKEGVGSEWARQAEPGKILAVAGPRGSRIVPYDFDWYLMVGDETAIPSIARRLQEMPKDKPVFAVIEVENAGEEVQIARHENAQVIWVHRQGQQPGDSSLLKETLLKLPTPAGDYFAWIAAENTCSQEVKEMLITVKGASEEWIKATGYWRK